MTTQRPAAVRLPTWPRVSSPSTAARARTAVCSSSEAVTELAASDTLNGVRTVLRERGCCLRQRMQSARPVRSWWKLCSSRATHYFSTAIRCTTPKILQVTRVGRCELVVPVELLSNSNASGWRAVIQLHLASCRVDTWTRGHTADVLACTA